jgi:hypothetical protein
MALNAFNNHGKRKFPRRAFKRSVGFLCEGAYVVGDGTEIGEGGLSLKLPALIPIAKQITLSFQIPGGSFVCVRAEVRSNAKDPVTGLFATGCLFQEIKFEHKREIRFYVSARV